MMHIDSANPIVEHSVVQYLKNSMNEPEHYNDFDCSHYQFSGNDKYFLLGLQTPGYADIMANGGKEMLQEKYGKYYNASVPGYDTPNTITLGVLRSDIPTIKKIPKDSSEQVKEQMKKENKEVLEKRKKIIKGIGKEFAVIKRNFIGAPIERALKAIKATPGNTNPEIPDSYACQIRYRPDEQYWIIPNKSTVIIVFSIDFKDPVDVGLARILLLEFHEARRTIKSMKNPPESKYYDKSLPPGLEKYGMELKKYSNGFVAFTVFKNNLEGLAFEKVVDFLVGFREYCQYHIHATKAFLHTRMRKKVTEFAKLIKDAKREKDEKKKKYKELIGGTTLNNPEEERDIKAEVVYSTKKGK